MGTGHGKPLTNGTFQQGMPGTTAALREPFARGGLASRRVDPLLSPVATPTAQPGLLLDGNELEAHLRAVLTQHEEQRGEQVGRSEAVRAIPSSCAHDRSVEGLVLPNIAADLGTCQRRRSQDSFKLCVPNQSLL